MSEPASPTIPEPETVAEQAPEPEPWTPERVVEWNSYYDLFVAGLVLVLAFFVAANMIGNSSIWSLLRAGEAMATAGKPMTVDSFSYTVEGKRWVNIPWLFELSQAALYKFASGLISSDPTDPGGSIKWAEQVGARTLVAINALGRLATVWLLLCIRRRGPGLWWCAICAALALGAFYSPLGIMLGGLAGPGEVSARTWGLLLLAAELLILYKTFDGGRRNAIYALIPLFALWANIDDSFLEGLLILAVAVIGLVDRGGSSVPNADGTPVRPGPGLGRGLVILAACAAACLLNPSVYHVFGAAAAPLRTAFQPKTDSLTLDQISFFGREIKESQQTSPVAQLLLAYYLIVVGIGLGSFLVNLRRFSLSRFLMYSLAAALWGYMMRYSGEFAVIFAATLALNGQEWYQDRFGAQGRLGRGWAVWSTGGRAVTIVLLALVLFRHLSGYGSLYGDVRSGFGFDPDNFDFEAADYLKTAPIKGRVLNTSRHQGDALLWRAYPARASFIDSRPNLFPQSLVNELQAIRVALKTNEKEKWKPLLDKYNISVVMLDVPSSPITYEQLRQSPDWIPFYDDGNTYMFGRADAGETVAEADVAYFRANRLDPEAMAYRRTKPIPSADRPPTEVGLMDEWFVTRLRLRPQPHDEAAARMFQGTNFDSSAPSMPSPAQCIMTIREARTALALKPDDPAAYRYLNQCYRLLMIEETALLQGIKLTPENAGLLSRLPINPAVLMQRYRQRVTALNYAIQTTPPPRTEQERRILQSLRLELVELFLSVNSLDMARDQLQIVMAGKKPKDFAPEVETQMARQLNELDKVVKAVQEQLSELTIERQAGPLERAQVAIQQRLHGIAIQELEEAERTNISPAIVKPQLVDLYCDTGQPDKAAALLGAGGADDMAPGSEPGTATDRQARVYLLLGNYEDAAILWEKRAIPQVRYDRTYRALVELRSILQGDPKGTVSTLLSIPPKIGLQATWEFDTAMCQLEWGMPEAAAEHFTKALTLAPDSTNRPLIAYYLEKLGKPVPPTSAELEKEAAKPAEKGPEKAEKPKADEPTK